MMKNLAVTFTTLTLLAQTPVAFAQAVGSKVEVSPLGINSQWLPGTVISVTSGGDYKVLLDPREGYGDNEEYIVQKRWLRGAATAPQQQQQRQDNRNRANGDTTRDGGAYKTGEMPKHPDTIQNLRPATIINSPTAPGSKTSGPLKVGDRVRYSPQFNKNENTWIMGTITSIEGGGSYGVKSDAKGPTNPSLFHTVREDFIKKDNTTAPKLAGPGNFPTTNKPIPTHETPVRPGSDCTPNEARYKAILEDHHRYNYGINYDQVDVSWDSFAIGAERKISTPQFNAPRAWMVNASYRVRAIRRYEQGGRKYVKTVVYQYAQPLLIFYVNDNGNCVFGGIDKSAGTLVYDQTDLVSQAQFDAAHKIVYARPNYLTCKCRKS